MKLESKVINTMCQTLNPRGVGGEGKMLR
jgi:hypothetical protein